MTDPKKPDAFRESWETMIAPDKGERAPRAQHRSAADFAALNRAWSRYCIAEAAIPDGIIDTLGTTPAVAAGIATRPWTVADLVAAALTAEPSEKPVAVPLALRPPPPGQVAPAARALPNGRGFLRAVPSGGGASPGAAPAPATPTPPAAPGLVLMSASPSAAVDDRQIDLFSWTRPLPPPPPPRPLPPHGSQLDLFPTDDPAKT